MRRSLSLLALAALVLPACGGGGGSGSGGGGSATPPVQASTGPGGAAATYATVLASSFGSAQAQFWIFEPQGSGSTPLPLVVFMHGYGALQPDLYQAWIDHIVRRGAIVVYPRYQADLLTPVATFTPNALAAIHSAIDVLQAGGHAVADLARTAVVGHSYGGVIAANLAALAATSSLPAFDALMCCAPGTGGFNTYANYADVPAGTLLLAIACANDTVVFDTDAKRIFLETTAVPLADKDFVLVRSDPHGTVPLVAEHGAPAASNAAPAPDALDFYGFWKWFDGLTDAAFYGTNRAYALGNTPEQRYMGTFGDGVPVVEPLVTDAP